MPDDDDLPPVRPGYTRDVPMTTETNESSDEITTNIEISGAALKIAIAVAGVLAIFLTPPAIWLWRWAL